MNSAWPFFTILDHFGPFRPFWTILDHFDHFDRFWQFLTILDHFRFFLKKTNFRIFPGRFDTRGSMLPHLVPEILILYAFCDVGVVGVVVGGIGDSRSWIEYLSNAQYSILNTWWPASAPSLIALQLISHPPSFVFYICICICICICPICGRSTRRAGIWGLPHGFVSVDECGKEAGLWHPGEILL